MTLFPKCKCVLAVLLCGGYTAEALAVNVTLSVAEIQAFVEDSRTNGQRLSELIGREVEERLSAEGLSLTEGGLLYTQALPDEDLRSGCSWDGKLSRAVLTVLVSPESEFQFLMESLAEPIVASIDFVGTAGIDGRLTLKYGTRVLGKCIRYGTDHVGVSASADIVLSVRMKILLNPTKTVAGNGDLVINIDPTIELSGEVASLDNIDFDFSDVDLPTTALIEELGHLYLVVQDLKSTLSGQGDFGVADANQTLLETLAEKQAELQATLDDLPTSFTIPGLTAAQLQLLLTFINDYEMKFPVSYEFLVDHKYDVLFSLLVGDEDSFTTLVGTSLACELESTLSVSMPTTTAPGGFVSTSFLDYCNEVLNADLGDADAWDGTSTLIDSLPWTLYPTTTLNLGVVPIASNYQPYMKRVKYKSVTVTDGTGSLYVNAPPWFQGWIHYDTPKGNGTCKLEMRIYKKDVAANNLKPLLAIHGGSWKHRGAAFIAMEAQLSQLTERGFVVFAPFYRLIDDSDGNLECNGASREDILEDVGDALDWVDNHKAEYGASGEVTVMGQSAGAHLAAVLAVNDYQRIEKALLLYPPVDLQDFLHQFQTGAYENAAGVEAVEGFFADLLTEGQTLADLSIYDSTVLANSFPGQIQSSPSVYPPMFLIHGRSDSLVPSRQSVRMCNALSGNAESGPAVDDGGDPATGGYRMVYKCDNRGSWLDIVAESEHALDACIPGSTCPAGSARSVTEVQASLKDAWRWLNEDIHRIPGRHPEYSWLVPIISSILE